MATTTWEWCKHCGKGFSRSFLLKHQHVCRLNPANQPLSEPYPKGCSILAVGCGHVYCQLLRNARSNQLTLGDLVREADSQDLKLHISLTEKGPT